MIEAYRNIIAKYSKVQISAKDVNNDLLLVDDLAYDSISFVSMIIALEEKYGFVFDDNYINLDILKSVNDVAEYIISRKQL